jgi:hypothetical protein
MTASSAFKALLSSLAIGLTLTLTGCGGGGGGGGGAAAPTSNLFNVKPSQGDFITGSVAIKNASGTSVGTGSCCTNGAVTINVPSSNTGILIVEVTGGTYWDEATGVVHIQSGVMRTVIPAVTGSPMNIAVNPLTNAAAVALGVTASGLPAGKTAASVQQANLTVADLMGLPGVDIVSVLPTPSCQTCAPISGVTSSDLIAGKLAALSYLAKSKSLTPDAIATELGTDIVLGPPGALNPADPILNAGTVNTAAASIPTTLVTPAAQGFLGANPAEAGLTTAQQTAIGTAQPPTANIAKAETFFAALRTGVMPYANPGNTGFLNLQGQALQTDANKLPTASMQSLIEVSTIAGLADEALLGQLPDGCTVISSTQATCPLFADAANTIDIGSVTLVLVSSSQATWQLYDASNNLKAGFKGTITIASNSSTLTLTMNGFVDSMLSVPGGKTKVGLGNTSTTITNATTGATCTDDDVALVLTTPSTFIGKTSTATAQFTLQGTMKDLVPDSVSGLKTCSGFAPDLKLAFGTTGSTGTVTPSTVSINHTDVTKDTGNFTGTFTTANYSFVGQLTASGITAITVAGQQDVNGGQASFTGSVSGIGLNYRDQNDNQVSQDTDSTNNFTILQGTLAASLSGASYNPTLAASATNNETSSLTFTGQVFLSATDPGLKLTVGLNQAWSTTGGNYLDTLSVSYFDQPDNLTVTGTASALEPSLTVSTVTLSGGNGVTVVWTQGASSYPVTVGGVQVGTIMGDRVTYTDGTFDSLI